MDMCINGVFYFQAQFAKQGRIACVLFEYRVNDDGIVGIVTAKDVGVGGRCCVEELSEKHNRGNSRCRVVYYPLKGPSSRLFRIPLRKCWFPLVTPNSFECRPLVRVFDFCRDGGTGFERHGYFLVLMNLQKNYNVDNAAFDATRADIAGFCESCYGIACRNVLAFCCISMKEKVSSGRQKSRSHRK